MVLLAAAQTFGIDAGRAARLRQITDSLELAAVTDTLHRADSIIKSDSLLRADSLIKPDSLLARDTIRIPDSLKEKDPFFFKYYIAVKDSTTRRQLRDSLLQAGDSLELHRFDSLYIKDSTEVATAQFNAWYSSLTRKERKKYDAEQALPALIAAANRKLEIKDSIRAYKDSVIGATPRILETFAIPDSMHYKRIITWKHERNFHNLVELREQDADTSFNHNFYDYPFFKEDVNATWLGVAGSPVEPYNFFKRRLNEDAKYFTPYQSWSFTPETLPMYNTKTPYTELAYWGTLFANQEKEESNIKVLTTQNITPELNLTLQYTNFSGNGTHKREDTGYRTFVAATNYMGKKYLMHAGFIYNRIERSENGGVTDLSMIRDTTVDAREIDVYLREAESRTRTNTVFLDQSYRIPFNFIEKIKENKRLKAEAAVRDSIMASGDSLAIAALKAKEEAELAAVQTQPQSEDSETVTDTVAVAKDITTAFIGHSSEFAVFRRSYTDKIATSDKAGREFYNDAFYLNPTQSKDSMRVMRIENKAFIRLQPWKSDGIVSKLDVGLGDKLLNFYSFRPSGYLNGPTNVIQNSLYLYAGANGQYKKYMNWNASGKYNFLGHEINDQPILILHRSDARILNCAQRVAKHRQTADTEGHQTLNLGIVEGHNQTLIGVLVVHIVNDVHRVDVQTRHPAHIRAEGLYHLVVYERHIRLEYTPLGSEQLARQLLTSAVKRHKKHLGKIATSTEELHLLTRLHRADAAGDGIVVTVAGRTHDLVVLILNGIRLDGHTRAVALERRRQSV